MCYDKEKNGKESDYHGKMEQTAVPQQVWFII